MSDQVRNIGSLSERLLEARQGWDSTVIRRALLAVLIVSLAVGLRVWGLNRTGFNTDEAVYAGQGAAIARDPILKEIFPVFRAHPLLFQFILALLFKYGVSDVGARLMAVAVGLATVYVVYRLGELLYGKSVGFIAALILALMPYHVIVTRQVLLDGPMVLCSTITLYMLARFAISRRAIWLYCTGIGMGLTFLSKETGIILMGAIYAFLALSKEIRVRLLDLVLASLFVVLMMVPFPAALLLAGGTKSGKQYLVWQLFRRPNHTWDFYPTVVPVAMGLLVVLAAVLGLWLLRKQGTWRERLLICWILVPVAFFQLWPTKGFQYLLPIAPAVAILAGRALAYLPEARQIYFRGLSISSSRFRTVTVSIVALSLLFSSVRIIQPSNSGIFIAGTGGVPGGREAGEWLRDNVPQGAKIMTIGPSMANILQFYGHRKAYGLSVSPNPLRRNPSYEPILNPDNQIRMGDLHYVVWDSFSAERSQFFSNGLMKFVDKYNGRVVHTESVMVRSESGAMVAKPVIIIYEVRP